MLGRSRSDLLTAVVFLLPAVVAVVALIALPVVDAVIMSFQRVALSGAREQVGLRNFELLLDQPRFWNNLRLSFVYLVGNLALCVPLGYGAAMLLAAELRGSSHLRTLFLFPWVMTPAVTALIFQSLVDPVAGPVTHIARAITGQNVYVLIDPDLALLTLVIHAAWRSFPLVMLFIGAGIAAIPREIYDAASLDGAGGWRLFRHITLPLTRVQLFIVVLVVTAFTLQDAESVFALTGGGPGNSTEVLAVRLLKEAFVNLNLGLGAAISVVLLAAGVLAMIGYALLVREERST
jgi:multiple sugar transport system permease protein